MDKTMTVRMRTQYAGPHGTCPAGGQISLPAAQAETLVREGYAEWADATAPKPAAPLPSSEPETATLPAAPETATAGPQRRRGEPASRKNKPRGRRR